MAEEAGLWESEVPLPAKGRALFGENARIRLAVRVRSPREVEEVVQATER